MTCNCEGIVQLTPYKKLGRKDFIEDICIKFDVKMFNYPSCLCLILLVTSLTTSTLGGVINDGGKVIKTVTGRMYLTEQDTGHQHRLTRRHIERDTESPKSVKLVLESDDNDIEMTLSSKSVWTEDSKAFARNGEDLVEVPVSLDSSCFVTGQLSSGEGSASFCNCYGFSGFIHTPDMEYLVEQSLDSYDDSETGGAFADVTVTMLTPETIPPYDLIGENDISDDDLDELDPEQDEENKYFENNNSTDRMKRQTGDAQLTAEVAVYADKDYADYLKSQNKDTLQKVTAHFITKWNAIAEVYGKVSDVGLKFTIQLKYVEIWRENPPFYVRAASSERVASRLIAFCRGTVNNKADHRMLYIYRFGGQLLGQALSDHMCTPYSCSIVQSRIASKFGIELHEFGHSIGFKHPDKMPTCPKPWGFMDGEWRGSYKFDDCYKQEFLQISKKSSRDCLRQVNIKGKALN